MVITWEALPPSLRTSRGCTKRSTFHMIARLCPAPQPLTCSSLPLPSPPHPPPPNDSFHVDRASRTIQWTYRARCRSHPLRIYSQLCTAQSSSARCSSQPNCICAPSQHPRHSQMQTCGRMCTTCSSSASGQVSTGPRCVLLRLVVSHTPPCVTDREPFFFLSSLVPCALVGLRVLL